MPGADLATRLGISQPTLSRTIQDAGVLAFRITGQRTPLYGLGRTLRGTNQALVDQPIYRIDSVGRPTVVGTVTLIESQGTLVSWRAGEDVTTRLYEGMPPIMQFTTLSGFMGRLIAQSVAQTINTPATLRDWSDDDQCAYLFSSAAYDLPGDLVFGDTALNAAIAARSLQPIPAATKLDEYRVLASDAAAKPAGSSAGGEQPKFACEAEDVGHVIVKFARSGTRMADLLQMEHLALNCLATVGIPAAKTTFLGDPHAVGEGLVFLEVQRFDRFGRFGRFAMLSAGCVDDEMFGKRDSWSQFAARCQAARMFTPAQAAQIQTLAAFSQLCGNTDTHFENVSVMPGAHFGAGAGPLTPAPAYDILPMQYARVAEGLNEDLAVISPRLAQIGVAPGVWENAYAAAHQFWHLAANCPNLSEPMRMVAMLNGRSAAEFMCTLGLAEPDDEDTADDVDQVPAGPSPG